MVTMINLHGSTPIKDHPHYTQRVRLIITAVIGGIFCLVSVIEAYWDKTLWVICNITLILSGVFSLVDLVSSRIFKKDLPRWIVLALDFVFCITLFILYVVVAIIARRLEQVYGNLAMLVACILHGWCIWKVIHEQLKRRWAKEVTFVCDQCQKRSRGKQPKFVTRGGRDSDDETDCLLYRDSTDEDAVEITPTNEELDAGRSKGKGKLVDEEAGA